jgi:hypothetical protein
MIDLMESVTDYAIITVNTERIIEGWSRGDAKKSAEITKTILKENRKIKRN